jgi:membrane associated rhomboid family serine protease
MAVCYRHPNRQTGVACSSCGRPICPDCMTPTSVGMRCPECARDRTKVRTSQNVRRRSSGMLAMPGRYSMVNILIAINVIVFVAEVATGTSLGGVSSFESAGTLYRDGSLASLFIHGANIPGYNHQPYRLLTSAFLHDGLLHIAFNMWFLFAVGPALEQAIGKVNFLAVYFASLLAGSFGALLFQPLSPTVGASGALFGLLGALIVIAHYRQISIWQSGLGLTLVVNIVFSLSISGISIGAHIGGLVGGAICGWLFMELVDKRRLRIPFLLGCAVVGVVAVVASYAIISPTFQGLTPNGISLF